MPKVVVNNIGINTHKNWETDTGYKDDAISSCYGIM